MCVRDQLSAVLERLSPADTEGDWHGACLAVAELCRRGLIGPERLDEVLPLVYKALVFELPRSNASIGDHVRDAACYVASVSYTHIRAPETVLVLVCPLLL